MKKINLPAVSKLNLSEMTIEELSLPAKIAVGLILLTSPVKSIAMFTFVVAMFKGVKFMITPTEEPDAPAEVETEESVS